MMDITRLNERISVAPQIKPSDIADLANAGFRAVVCNRPDNEEQHQPNAHSMAEAAQAAGLTFVHLPAVSGALTDQNAADMARALESLPSAVLAYCRSGARSTRLIEMAGAMQSAALSARTYDFVIVGGGSAGIATAASILKRNRDVTVAIDGDAKVATFERKNGDAVFRVEEHFDMIHVVPPQVAPDFVRSSPLAASTGFIEVNEATLQHVRYPNVFALSDACSTSNAKTMAAARKQAPVVAVNALSVLNGKAPIADYDGYGGKLLPSFPNWMLKDTILPPVYWHGMLKGREWMVKPHMIGS